MNDVLTDATIELSVGARAAPNYVVARTAFDVVGRCASEYQVIAAARVQRLSGLSLEYVVARCCSRFPSRRHRVEAVGRASGIPIIAA